jgi:hypothetical protein
MVGKKKRLLPGAGRFFLRKNRLLFVVSAAVHKYNRSKIIVNAVVEFFCCPAI